MKKFVAIFLALMFIFVAVSVNAQSEYPTSTVRRLKVRQWISFPDYDNYFWMRGYRVMGDSLHNIPNRNARGLDIMWTRNASGSTVKFGEVLIWNNVPLIVVDTVAYVGDPDTCTIVDDLSSEVWALKAYTVTWSLADACSFDVTGIPYGETAAKTETIIHTTTGVMYTSTYPYWTSITQVVIRGHDANDSVSVGAYHDQSVTATHGASSTQIAGVCFSDSAVDNSWFQMAYEGYFDSVKIDCSGAEMIIGGAIESSSSAGKGVPSAATVGAVLGRAMSSGMSDGYFPVMLRQE